MNRKQKKWKHVLLTLVLAMLCVAGFNIFSMNRILLDEAQVMGTEIAKRLAALSEKTGMLLMACDRCCIQREIDDKLIAPAGIGCFPNVYTALAGANIDQVITL